MASERRPSGCFGLLFGIFGSKSSAKGKKVYPYRVRDHYLSAAELDFYHLLRDTVQDRAVIVPQAGLWSIFYAAYPYKNDYTAMNRIDRKRVDFLLCNPESMQPIVGIELDDKSHNQPDRRKRDAEVNAVFAEANLPLLHVKCRRNYETADIAEMLLDCLGDRGSAISTPRIPTPAAVKAARTNAPLCPKCGSEMVIRVASQGRYKGQDYYVCSDYSSCRTYFPAE